MQNCFSVDGQDVNHWGKEALLCHNGQYKTEVTVVWRSVPTKTSDLGLSDSCKRECCLYHCSVPHLVKEILLCSQYLTSCPAVESQLAHAGHVLVLQLRFYSSGDDDDDDDVIGFSSY